MRKVTVYFWVLEVAQQAFAESARYVNEAVQSGDLPENESIDMMIAYFIDELNREGVDYRDMKMEEHHFEWSANFKAYDFLYRCTARRVR